MLDEIRKKKKNRSINDMGIFLWLRWDIERFWVDEGPGLTYILSGD